MVVVACNTATAAAISHLRATFDIPIVGLEPAVKPACAMTRSKVVGVIATERSLKGEKFLSTVARYGEGVEVIKAVGEGFVEAVERNEEQQPETEQAVRRVVEPIIERGADVIVLGCTHYPFLSETISKVASELYSDRELKIIDPAPAVARHALEVMEEKGLISAKGFSMELHASGDDTNLRKLYNTLY